MTAFLPPNLLALFEARPPVQYLPPVDDLLVDKNAKRAPMTGVAQYIGLFEDPKDTPAKIPVVTKAQAKEEKRRQKEELLAYKVEQGIATWNPAENSRATEDPYRTLFVGRINYETSESKLRREFEAYGKIKKLTMVHDEAGKPRGYAFIEYSDKAEMHTAYKKADGIKVDGKRLVVDYERGRTQKTWLPRRLGGGKGDTRKTRESKAAIEEREMQSGYEERDRDRSGSRDRRQDSYRNGGGNDRDRRESSGGFRDSRGGNGGYGGVPPLRSESESRSKESLSWLEEYLEGKDEVLLYITAALGVLMPGFVYLLYHKCHAYYERYAKKKEEQKLAEELAQSEAVVIVLGKDDGLVAPWAKIIHDKLSEEMVRKPVLWWSDTLDVKELMAFKGFCIFIAETIRGGQPTPSTEWFLEWLEDVAADSKLRKMANFDKIRFSIVGFGSSDDGPTGFNKVARTLLKRLKIVGSKQITEVELFNTSETDNNTIDRFIEFSFDLLIQMDKNLPGMSEETDDSDALDNDVSSESSSEEDEEHKKTK